MTMYDVRLKNRQAGKFFFEPATLRFFRSRIGLDLYGDRYFVTSEQFVGSDHVAHARRYTVREVKPSGDIDTVGEFQAYASGAAARRAIQRMLREPRGGEAA